MKTILMDTYKIMGENAEAAADYINDQESRMISIGVANKYFSEDYHENMNRFKAEATEKFGVTIENLF
nr:MAG TPA: hypothetical protein [Caudoviricetes sp.]